MFGFDNHKDKETQADYCIPGRAVPRWPRHRPAMPPGTAGKHDKTKRSAFEAAAVRQASALALFPLGSSAVGRFAQNSSTRRPRRNARSESRNLGACVGML